MTALEIASSRIHHHTLQRKKMSQPDQVVSWFGAMQAQDYRSIQWGIGIRCANTTEAAVEQAIASGRIIRTWALRGTLHCIAASDLRWLLSLLGPTIIARTASSYRNAGLDDKAFTAITRTLRSILQGGRQLPRKDLFDALAEHAISTDGPRGNLILYRAALSGEICLGAMRGRQTTYTLLDEWVPDGRDLDHDEALAELAIRYFRSHGPATLQDFIWWSSLRAADARAGLEMIQSQLSQHIINGTTYWMPRGTAIATISTPMAYLLPGFDEYLLGYKDRDIMLHPARTAQVISSNGIFSPTIVMDGQIVGTWKRTMNRAGAAIVPTMFRSLTGAEQKALWLATQQYGYFLDMPVTLVEPGTVRW